MTSYLHGIHDSDLSELMAHRPGWIVITVAVGHDPYDFSGIDLSSWKSRGFSVIVRINNAYGSGGTVPLPNEYQHYAVRCANFVAASREIERVIISNEPNILEERPNGVAITPSDYAPCFCIRRDAIKSIDPSVQVLTAAIAPYNADTGDCMEYYREMMRQIALNGGCDGFAWHAYTRTANPADITSTVTMQDPPLTGQYSGFLTYQDQAECIPAVMLGLPAYISEFDETTPWVDANTGVVQAAYAEIDRWNRDGGVPAIYALCLYRSNRDDQWSFADKPGVQADFSAAVARGYETSSVPPYEPSPPFEPGEPDDGEGGGEPPRDIDPRLIARGVELQMAMVAPGQQYWRVTKAEWLDDAANQVGPDHHALGNLLVGGFEKAGVPIWVDWPNGSTTVYSKSDEPNASYNWNYPLSPSLNEFSFVVADGNPSDRVSGVGMGYGGNPNAHSSTWITWELVTASEPEPPIPPLPPLRTKLIWPVVGTVTQYFADGGPQFGMPGHDGIDIACRQDTPIVAIADGEVAYIDEDRDYGIYVRIWHKQIYSHAFFAHLNSVTVKVGDQVMQGQTVAMSGNTGNSTGPHLHFEMRGCDETGEYVNTTVGYPRGRYNPQDAYLVTGSPVEPA